MRLVLPGCSLCSRATETHAFQISQFKSWVFAFSHVKTRQFPNAASLQQKHAAVLSAKAPLLKRVTSHHMGKNLDRVLLPYLIGPSSPYPHFSNELGEVLYLQNLLCHLRSKVSPMDCKVPSSETVTWWWLPYTTAYAVVIVSKQKCKCIKSSNLERKTVLPPCVFLECCLWV